MKDIKKKYNIEKNNFSLLEVVVITLAFCSLTGIIVGLTVYFKNNRNLILDDELLDIVDTYNKITNNFYGQVDASNLATSAIDGMMHTLNEEYSIYMNQEDTSSLFEKLEGEYRGVGITVTKQDSKIKVLNVYAGTPAEKSGLKENDILLKVNDHVIKEDDELDYISSLIKEAKKVTLKVLRDEEEKDIKIDVKTIEYPAIDYKIIEVNNKNIGYIYLSTFSKTSANQVKTALKYLEDNNIDSLIFDVRSNTGGYLEAADEILNMFIKKGKVLYSVENNDGNKKIYDTTEEHRTYDIVVLINQVSASASEILASSLKESYGAILVGTTTYGKGLVQQTNYLSDNSMIKYTTARWYTPLGNFVNNIGYNPSITVELTKEYAENPIDENDTQLQKSLEILSK